MQFEPTCRASRSRSVRAAHRSFPVARRVYLRHPLLAEVLDSGEQVVDRQPPRRRPLMPNPAGREGSPPPRGSLAPPALLPTPRSARRPAPRPAAPVGRQADRRATRGPQRRDRRCDRTSGAVGARGPADYSRPRRRPPARQPVGPVADARVPAPRCRDGKSVCGCRRAAVEGLVE